MCLCARVMWTLCASVCRGWKSTSPPPILCLVAATQVFAWAVPCTLLPRSIVVPNVVMTPGGRSYDINSWRRPDKNATANATASTNAPRGTAPGTLTIRRGASTATGTSMDSELHMEGYGRTGVRAAAICCQQPRPRASRVHPVLLCPVCVW